jgi:hypothetical protein
MLANYSMPTAFIEVTTEAVKEEFIREHEAN